MLKILIELIVIIVAWFLIVSFFAFNTSIRPKKIESFSTPKSLGYQYETITFQTEDGLNLKGWFIPLEAEHPADCCGDECLVNGIANTGFNSPCELLTGFIPARSHFETESASQTEESSTKTIIILHGYPAEKGDVLPWALFLHNQYHLFFFDFRFFGESEGSYTTIGWKEQKDLKAAVEYLKTRSDTDSENIGVMGFSLGGAVAIMASSENPEIKAIVADSTYANLDLMAESLFQRFFIFKKPMVWCVRQWSKLLLHFDFKKVSPLDSVRNSNPPLLLIHGEKDSQIPIAHSRMIFKAAKEPKELWEVNESDHGEAYFRQKEIYEQKVMGFLGRYLSD